MGRYRNYGQARGTRSYLSRFEEYSLTPEEQHAAYLRRKAADEAAVKKFASTPPKSAGPISHRPANYAAMLEASDAEGTAAPAPVAAGHSAGTTPGGATQSPTPQTGDLFAFLEEEDASDVVGEAPAP
jgi:hypothetical protein